jgi:drug/metabolite transporter (DMT)-like permease
MMVRTMDTVTGPVTVAVLGSAVLHASWNALAKAIPHRLLASALIGSVFAVGGGAWCLFAPVPAAASWPYLAASAVLQTGYLLLLTAAYAHGEFGRVYPIARGTAPLLVTVFALVVLGERLHAAQLAGIALVVAALAGLVLLRGLPGRGDGLGLAAATGVVIASYTLVDGIGVRHSGTAAGYAAWLMFANGPLMVAACLALAGPRQLAGWIIADLNPARSAHAGSTPATGDGNPAPGPLTGTSAATGDGNPGRGLVTGTSPATGDRSPRRRRGRLVAAGLAGGALSVAAYAIVLWAQSRSSLALVSALRETSVLFAGAIGALFFGERFSARQTAASLAAVAGILLIQLG